VPIDACEVDRRGSRQAGVRFPRHCAGRPIIFDAASIKPPFEGSWRRLDSHKSCKATLTSAIHELSLRYGSLSSCLSSATISLLAYRQTPWERRYSSKRPPACQYELTAFWLPRTPWALNKCSLRPCCQVCGVHRCLESCIGRPAAVADSGFPSKTGPHINTVCPPGKLLGKPRKLWSVGDGDFGLPRSVY